MKNILYICVGNTCRSIMAEALTKSIYSNKYNALSASKKNKTDNEITENTKQILIDNEMWKPNLTPKSILNFEDYPFDLIVILDDEISKDIETGSLILPPHEKLIITHINDPYDKDKQTYKKAFSQIQEELKKILI